MTDFVQVVTTVSTRQDADRLARLAVEARLAACAQVLGPVSSTYHWQGKVESAEEFMVVLKSSAGLQERLRAALAAQHPYDVPEILSFAVMAGNRAYLDWMAAELEGGETE